ncbi:hypothetical protein TNIN_63831 [Trichonephila inaurata madagascariensis]|uniref:Uncharacterized protein n=1 Tax=Trichonephila inaurata madagascariensis TaxID=2747483 RepID=A0A8X6YU21_9ARAC|nr:hypothetical protein TNIN_63831 [Trichonephila inaurata madagascariensis]
MRTSGTRFARNHLKYSHWHELRMPFYSPFLFLFADNGDPLGSCHVISIRQKKGLQKIARASASSAVAEIETSQLEINALKERICRQIQQPFPSYHSKPRRRDDPWVLEAKGGGPDVAHAPKASFSVGVDANRFIPNVYSSESCPPLIFY